MEDKGYRIRITKKYQCERIKCRNRKNCPNHYKGKLFADCMYGYLVLNKKKVVMNGKLSGHLE